jgi:hypothetical protein
MTLPIRNGEKSKPMTWKWKILWIDPPLEWKKNHLMWFAISVEKKSHSKWPSIGGPKKKKVEVLAIGGKKRSLELIPIGVKRSAIGNEKKVIRVTPTRHVSEKNKIWRSISLKKTWPATKISFSHELTPLVGEKKNHLTPPPSCHFGGLQIFCVEFSQARKTNGVLR